MQSLQRAVARSVRSQLNGQTRRHASGSHGHGAQHTGPTTESFGPGFYFCLAAIPTGLILYKITRPGPDGQPYFSRLIGEKFASYKTEFLERADSHTQAMERAAADRTLFLNESAQNTPRYVDLRYPEMVNASSPYNVPAGHGSANMDKLIAKYQKQAFEENEKKHQQIKDNKVPVEQPYESFRKITPAAPDS